MDEYSVRKVKQEIMILKKIRHPNVVRMYEYFESDTHIYIVMEYLDKGDLLSYLKRHG